MSRTYPKDSTLSTTQRQRNECQFCAILYHNRPKLSIMAIIMTLHFHFIFQLNASRSACTAGALRGLSIEGRAKAPQSLSRRASSRALHPTSEPPNMAQFTRGTAAPSASAGSALRPRVQAGTPVCPRKHGLKTLAPGRGGPVESKRDCRFTLKNVTCVTI